MKKTRNAYMRGFCKIAEACGADPQELMKIATGLNKRTIDALKGVLSPYTAHKFTQHGMLTPGVDMGKRWLELARSGKASVGGGLAERAVHDIVGGGRLVSDMPGLKEQLASLLRAQK